MSRRLLDRTLSLVGVGLLSLSAATFATAATAPAAAAAAEERSAVTVAGRGAFAGLRVTVGKTRDLVNEVVPVTWSGGTPTRGNFGTDYLQVMQCWGDANRGPEREQCQFGGLTGDLRGSGQVASRQVTYDFVDPAETYLRANPTAAPRFVPFRSVNGKTVESGRSEFFDASTTNESPFSLTRADGGGVLPFEVQTTLEAPGLGCGTARSTATGPSVTADTATVTTAAAGTVSRPGLRCWLVVVPRSNVEVDGSVRVADTARPLQSSPLSATNWSQRLVVPLDFQPLGAPCPLGRSERPVVGHEDVAEALASWSPALCRGAGPVFSYSQLPDAAVRRQSTGPGAPLGITSRPVPPSETSPLRQPVYAPVALSGVAIAFNIERQSTFTAPAPVKALDGQRVEQLNLTPRLVAKLLTQSYRSAAAVDRPGLAKNPQDLTRDPEFLAANPLFVPLSLNAIPSIVVPAGLADSNGLVWEWLLGDPDARAFLSGTPDPSGAVVNPAYLGTGLQDGFPKSDQVCTTFLTSQPPLCTLDAFPYAGDTHEAARGAARGDTLARSAFDPSTVPPTYRRALPQPTGTRAVLALTDTATAARFGLQTASLRNASGAFVAPDTAGLLAGLAAMTPSEVPGVVEPAPGSTAPAAYPLPTLSYALATPSVLSAAARADYAALLRYAVGAGQAPGTGVGGLPPGYAPLPTNVREATLATVARVLADAPAATTTPSPSVVPPTEVASTEAPYRLPPYRRPAYRRPLLPAVATATATITTLPAGAGAPEVLGLPTFPSLPSGSASTPLLGGIDAPVPTGTGPLPAPAPAPVAAGGGAVPLALPASAATAASPGDFAGAGRYGVVVALGLGGIAALGGSWLRRPRAAAPLP